MRALVEQRQRPSRSLAEDDVDVLECDGVAITTSALRRSGRLQTRSRMMASTTMARPASMPIGMLTVLSARTTGLPSPLAPTSAAITTIDRQSMMHWVRPAMIVGSAEGSSTFQRSWRLVAPKASPASISCFGTEVMPRWVSRIGAGMAKIDGARSGPARGRGRRAPAPGSDRRRSAASASGRGPAGALVEPLAMRRGDADRHADRHRRPAAAQMTSASVSMVSFQ